MGKYLVGMDAGTTGCKVCVFDLEGNLMGSNYREYPCYYPKEGWVEQIPEDMTPALYATCKAAIEKSGVNPKDILAIGLSSQGSVIGLLDEDGKLIRPFVGWQDLRGGAK
ncbi:MAG: FGGY family carbohydrate kinase, partial [Eubacterium sp.]